MPGTCIKPVLIQAARAAIRVRGRRRARYSRLVRRFGGAKSPAAKKKAITAIAHTLLKIACQVLTSGTPYQEPGAGFYTRRRPHYHPALNRKPRFRQHRSRRRPGTPAIPAGQSTPSCTLCHPPRPRFTAVRPPGNPGNPLLTLWTAAVRQTLHPGIDQRIKARLTESEGWRYDREPSRRALQQKLRAAQLAGHDITALIGQITAAPMDGAQSIASVLHGRLQRLALSQLAGHDLAWAQRTPASAPAAAHELAAALDARARVLGDQAAAAPSRG
ncbi:MAG TPA: hypothetical protein VFW50_14020 [Streptosporangiaceae bacterium]|nr:hypothetical protein [Streptosporangiaceae bacterium]